MLWSRSVVSDSLQPHRLIAHQAPLGWEDPLEKGMATHSSLLAWRIPWTEGSPKPLFKVSTPLVRGDSQRFLCSWALEHSSVSEASTGFLRHHLRNPHQEAVSPRVSGFNLSPQELWPLPSGLCSCQTLLFLCSFLPHPWQQPGL